MHCRKCVERKRVVESCYMATKKNILQKRAENIQKIYNDFSNKLSILQKKQREEIKTLLSSLEKEKIQKVRKTMLESL